MNSGSWNNLIPRGPAVIGLAIIVFGFGGFIAWASLANLDSAAIAHGQLVPEGSTRLVQHLEGGIIEASFVRNGDRVRKGQALFRLQDTRARAAYEIVRSELDNALVRKARLDAERNGLQQIIFPKELLDRRNESGVRAEMLREEQLFSARRANLNAQISIQRQKMNEYREQIIGLQAEEGARQDQLRLLEEELESLRTLADRGGIPLNTIRSYEREVARLKGEWGRYHSSIAGARETLAQAELQILALRKNFQQEVVTELSGLLKDITGLQERLTDATDILNRTLVRSPVDGIVMSFTNRSPGIVIQPGIEVMRIVPSGERLIAEAMVSPSDIDNVALGQQATVSLSSLNRRTTPKLPGDVIYLSADRMEDPATGASYYLARVELKPESIDFLKDVKLEPGMPVEVFIDTGRRTALEYLLTPMRNAMSRALREQ